MAPWKIVNESWKSIVDLKSKKKKKSLPNEIFTKDIQTSFQVQVWKLYLKK